MRQKDPAVDEKDFFKQVTLRICGSLELETALQRCWMYLKDIIPVDELILTAYDSMLGTIEVVATATERGGAGRSEKIPLPRRLRKEIEEADRFPRVRFAADVFQDPILGRVAKHMGWDHSSIMVGRLMVEGKYVGAISARAYKTGQYTEWHAGLWSLVNEPTAIALANSQRFKEVLRFKDLLADDRTYLQNELRRGAGVELIGADFGLRDVMEHVHQVARLPSPVLLHGDTGTGKEIVANIIHSLSLRSEGPFITVNCGAIPETLIDSELFGHEKGAFTGAISQKRGRFERAHGGTIFLDEVGELPLQAQVRLLRVLQQKEIERVGGTSLVKVDVRIISATNRNLEALVAAGAFREDLYFRIRVFPISLPPLRERKNDIPALVHHFIYKKSREMVLPKIPILENGAIDTLMAYDWPGNVRELENAVERAIILSGGQPLEFGNIIDPINRKCTSGFEEKILTLHAVEAAHIRRALEAAGGRVEGKGGAAELLALNPGTLRHRMRKLDISFGRRRNGI